MTQGNRINHKKKWALDSDLKELKEKVYHFIDNDFVHFKNKVSLQNMKINFLMALVALILALMAILVVKII